MLSKKMLEDDKILEINHHISIIIPVYNGSNYLREAIESALAQVYPNFEILVINDGSNDNDATRKIALSHGKRVRYLEKPHGGVASALNLGLRAMRGEYFSWLSHDDVYLPDKLKIQMDYVRSLPGHRKQNIFLFGAYKLVDAKLRQISEYHAEQTLLSRSPYYSVFRHMINGCTTLISKSLLVKAGGFRDFPTTQDYEMWFRLLFLAKPVYLDEVVLLSRQHSGQGFRSPEARAEASATFVSMMKDLSDNDIRAYEPDVGRFFATIARGFCEIDLKEAHDYAWSRASGYSRFLHRISPKHNLKLILARLGILNFARRCRRHFSTN